ncbi:MAG: TIGR03546 family protein [Planctomycetota bacterium]
MFTWRILNRLYKLLNGEISPKQIAGGIAFGMIIGLTPTFSLHNLLVVLLICVIRVNVASVIFSAVIFGMVSYLTDPAAHLLGYALLVKMEFLKPLWTMLYNMPLVPLTGFNNTLLMGSVIIALALFYPNMVLSERGLVAYRASLKPKLENTRFVKVLKASWMFRVLERIRNF